MDSDNILGGVMFLPIIFAVAVFLLMIGLFVHDVITPDTQQAPTEQAQPAVQNQTVPQQEPTNSDYNIDYWKNRIQERKASSQ